MNSASDDDGVSNFSDNMKSVTGSEKARYQSLQKDYSTEECYIILSSMGLGYSPDQASRKATSLTENVKSVDLSDPRKMFTGTDKLSDTQVGRNIFEAVRIMIAQGNEPLVSVVKTNYPLDSYLSNIQSTMYEIEESIATLEQNYVEPVEPREDRLKLRLEVDLENKEEELRNNALQDYKVRTGEEESRQRPRTRAIQSELDIAESWEGSPEFLFFEACFANFSKVANRKYKEELLVLYSNYDLQVNAKVTAMKTLKKQREDMRRQQVLEIFVSELQKQCNIVIQKVKTALINFPFIREKLSFNVIVNGDSVIQPLLTENLSGIYALLHNEYNKITMGAFCDYLMVLMSESSTKDESTRNPQVQLKRIDKHLKTWLDMDLEKFMTPDHLFTICLLKSYHPETVIRTDGVRHMLEYSRRLDGDKVLKSLVGEYANMPLYTELVRWINDVHVKSMQFSNTTRSTSTINNNNTITSTEKKQPSMEQAASATGAPSSISSKQTTPKPPPNCTYATGPYDTDVLSSRNLYAKSGFRYQALKNKCTSCPHRPKCYNYKCTTCGYWGHKEDDCCQLVSR